MNFIFFENYRWIDCSFLVSAWKIFQSFLINEALWNFVINGYIIFKLLLDYMRFIIFNYCCIRFLVWIGNYRSVWYSVDVVWTTHVVFLRIETERIKMLLRNSFFVSGKIGVVFVSFRSLVTFRSFKKKKQQFRKNRDQNLTLVQNQLSLLYCFL